MSWFQSRQFVQAVRAAMSHPHRLNRLTTASAAIGAALFGCLTLLGIALADDRSPAVSATAAPASAVSATTSAAAPAAAAADSPETAGSGGADVPAGGAATATDAATGTDAAATPDAAPASADAASPGAAPASADGAAPPTPPAAPLPLDQQPYRVLVAVGIAPDPELPAALRESLTQELSDRIVSRLGPLWVADVARLDALGSGRREALEQFSPTQLTETWLPSEFDKVFFATVEAVGAGFRISAREWDRNSQTATASTSRMAYDHRVLADQLLAEALLHFRPIASIETVAKDGTTAELRIRGGELIPPDPSLAPLAAGMYLRPYFRYLDRKRELRQLQEIPWTYLQATSVERGRMQVELTTAFAGILSGSRRRTELMAILVRPRYESTALRIVPRGQPENPMAGVRVDLLDRRPTADDAVDDRLTFYTDRFGEVRAPANSEQPLQHIYVLSGKGVLATVPFIPGDQPAALLDVPDDGPRLLVEGEVAIIEAELIELVARREVTIARALGYARGGRWEQADPLIEEVKRLPTREAVNERLDRIRLPAIETARRTRNRVAESRINQMCAQLKEHIDKHLNPQRTRDFLQEITEMRRAG